MVEETTVDRDYLEAFNLGYELARELKLKSPMFQGSATDNVRMNAMQCGMAQFSKEMELDNENSIPKKHRPGLEKGLDRSI